MRLARFEQLVTYSGSEIVLEDVLAVLGVADARLLEATIDAVAEGDARRALTVLAECAEQGRDAASFAGDLKVHARELLVVQTLGGVPGELSLTPEADAALLAQAERVPANVVVALLEAVGGAMEAVRAGADARTRLELALVKAAKPDVDASMRALLARIERLEGGGGAVETGASESEPRAPVPAPAPEPARGPSAPLAAEQRRPDPPSPAPAEARTAPQAETQPEAAVEVTVASIAAAPERGESQPTPDVASVTPDAAPQPGEPATPVAQAIAEDLAPLLSWWPAVVELVRTDNALLGACIEEARPVEVTGEDLTVAFSATAPFLKKKAENPDNRAAVTAALRDVTGRRWRLSYELHDELVSAEGEGPGTLSEEEWLKRFIDEFDAEELPSDDAARANGEAVTTDQEGA